MKYDKRKLDNGLQLIYFPMKNSKNVSMGIFVGVGSRYEDKDNAGISHFMEHMLFKGTQNRSVVQLLKDLASLYSYNAYTTYDYTCYQATCKSSHIKKMIDILLDMYINPKLSTEDINNERKVVREELKLYDELPSDKIYAAINMRFRKNTTYEHPIIGYEKTLKQINRTELINFYNKYYVPKNTIMVITGDFIIEPIHKLLSRVLIPLNNNNYDLSADRKLLRNEYNFIYNTAMDQSTPYIYIKKNRGFKQSYVTFAYPMMDISGKYKYVYEMISKILTSDLDSRLYLAIRNNHGMIYNIRSSVMNSNIGLFVISVVISPEYIKKLFKIIFHELEMLCTNLISKTEFTANMVAAGTRNRLLHNKRPNSVMMYIGNKLIKKNIERKKEKPIRPKHIDRQLIRKTCQGTFINNRLNVFIYGNINEDINYKRILKI